MHDFPESKVAFSGLVFVNSAYNVNRSSVAELILRNIRPILMPMQITIFQFAKYCLRGIHGQLDER